MLIQFNDISAGKPVLRASLCREGQTFRKQERHTLTAPSGSEPTPHFSLTLMPSLGQGWLSQKRVCNTQILRLAFPSMGNLKLFSDTPLGPTCNSQLPWHRLPTRCLGSGDGPRECWDKGSLSAILQHLLSLPPTLARAKLSPLLAPSQGGSSWTLSLAPFFREPQGREKRSRLH